MEKMGGLESVQDAETKSLNTTIAQHTPDNVPDPDEDDLDDLDDMLDEFSAATVDSKSNAPKSVVPERVENHVTPGLSDAVTSDFSKQLQEQMAALMGEIDESPGVRQEIEVMMQEIGAAVDSEPKAGLGSSSGVTANTATSSSGAEEPFQETIRKTMERMQASGEQAAAAASEDSEDILAQMLKEMEGGDINGAGDEGKFSKMLMGMMEQLTNRDILYEPMKELHEKFPAWMSKNGSSTDRGDLRRYEEQQRLVGEIVGKFEAKGYSDSNPTDREFIVERMQQMQAAGSPPADLVGDMNAAQEALGDLDSGCPQQ